VRRAKIFHFALTALSFFLKPLLRLWLRKAKPQTSGEVFIPGLKEKVKVFWDPYAVPHIFAASERDLFLAQGYLHAQERLWQMESKRRFLSGRLAEIVGETPVPWRELSIQFRDRTTVDLDHFVRLMGMRRAACASLKLLPEEYVDRLKAYSEGVNRYIETHLKSLPLEFRLLRCEPEPWQPEDTLTIGKGFAFFLSTSLFTRLTLIAIADKLKVREDELRSLMPVYPSGEPTITRTLADDPRALLRFLNGTFQKTDWAAGAQGSNNWVVAPWRSSTGSAILCNDPHLRMDLPSFWYLMHLKAARTSHEGEDFEVWGGSIAGSPCIHLGYNRWIAWGVAAALCDDADLYRERIHPNDPDLHLADGQWKRMEQEEEKITVRGGREVIKRIRFSSHGPLISDFAREGSGATEEALSLKWTAHAPSQEMRALYGVNQARNWEEFLRSISYQVAPTLNFVFADNKGNIGYSLAGKVPMRSQPPSLLPLPGENGELQWKGYIPFDELPRLYNPPEGAIATANNRIVNESYPHHLFGLFDPPYRIRRIRELLASKERLSTEDMAEIQRDVVSVQGREMVTALRSDLKEIARKENSLRKAAERLLRWDGSCSEASPEAALFHLFYQRLITNLLTPILGQELFIAYVEIFNQSLAPVDNILRNPQSPWFEFSSRQALVKKSLQEATDELAQRLGADMEQWRWGKLHTLTLQHPLGRIRVLAPLLSIGPFPSPGDGVTINMGFYRRSNPYEHVVGASLRMIIDMAAPERSLFILPSGQSGHCFSPHYRDQTQLWRQGRYIRLSHDAEEAKEWPLLTLTPHR
jgi:penicillin amidase